MNKIFRKEVIIGIIVLVSLAILFFVVNFLKGVNVFKGVNYYSAVYENVEGLAVSAPVTVNGFKIGLVREINYEYDNPGHIRVEISLDKNLKIPYGTKAVLQNDLLGTANIALEMGTGSEFYKIGSELPAEVQSGLMDNISTSLMPGISGIVPKIDTLLVNLNAITGNPALATSIARLDAITRNLEQTTAKLNATVATLPPITSDVKAITGSLAVQVDGLSTMTGKLSQVPVDSLAENLNQTIANLRELSEQLNDPNSTIGKLTHDPELYNSINSTVSSLDSLFVDIKKNPKRYINIKLL